MNQGKGERKDKEDCGPGRQAEWRGVSKMRTGLESQRVLTGMLSHLAIVL